MKKLIPVMAAVAMLVGGAVWLRAADTKTTKADIKELMRKTNKGEESPMGKLSKELKADEPSWDEVQKQLKELRALSSALADCEETNKRAAEGYQKGVTALDEAATKKDKAAAVEARSKLLNSCFTCHYGGAPGSTGGGRK
jgi:hypothetical protein